jgi:hypothetical protein
MDAQGTRSAKTHGLINERRKRLLWRMKMASTHGTAQASAPGGFAAPSTLEGAKFLYPLTRIATTFPPAASSPTPRRLPFRAARPTPSSWDATPFRIQTCHDALSEGLALATCRKPTGSIRMATMITHQNKVVIPAASNAQFNNRD